MGDRTQYSTKSRRVARKGSFQCATPKQRRKALAFKDVGVLCRAGAEVECCVNIGRSPFLGTGQGVTRVLLTHYRKCGKLASYPCRSASAFAYGCVTRSRPPQFPDQGTDCIASPSKRHSIAPRPQVCSKSVPPFVL